MARSKIFICAAAAALVCLCQCQHAAGDKLQDDYDFVDRDDPQLEACPRLGLTDTQLSACFTRVFKTDLLPHFREGIPLLGIRSIDPIHVPYANFTFLDIGVIKWLAHVRDLVVTGSANMSRSDIKVDTTNQTMTGLLNFPRIEGKSEHTTVDGHVFGVPMRWFTQEGGIVFRIDDLRSVSTFRIWPQREELFQLINVEYEVQGFLAQAVKITRPAWIDTVVNWLMRRYSKQLFEYIIRPGFHEIFENMTTFMEPKAWRVIIGDL